MAHTRGPRDRLVRNGVLLSLVGLLMGMVTYSLPNPRMGLSAHVGTVMTGIFVVAMGAAWDTVVLTPGAERTAIRLFLVGNWGSALSVFLAALLDTRDATPIHGAAVSAAAWKETLATASLTVFAVVLLAGVAMVLYGLRKRAAA